MAQTLIRFYSPLRLAPALTVTRRKACGRERIMADGKRGSSSKISKNGEKCCGLKSRNDAT